MLHPDIGSSSEPCRPVILCIDDDPQITEAIRIRMRDFDVDVLCAAHGIHGFWLAMIERPDLIITDMRMPQGQGDYVVHCLRHNSDTRTIPVIVLTGQRIEDVRKQLDGMEVNAVLTKPVMFEKLKEAIAAYVPLRERDYAAASVGQPN